MTFLCIYISIIFVQREIVYGKFLLLSGEVHELHTTVISLNYQSMCEEDVQVSLAVKFRIESKERFLR